MQTGTATVSDSKKAAFEQQFACSGPASPPRETKVRTVVDGVAALDKYTTGGVNFTSMTSAPALTTDEQEAARARGERAHVLRARW